MALGFGLRGQDENLYSNTKLYSTRHLENVKAKDKQEAIDICMGGRNIDDTTHEDTVTEVKEVEQ